MKGHGVRQTTPNDAFFSSRQWSHSNDGTFTLSPATVDADIDTDLAWDITQGDSNTIVAILDTGLRLRHPEFTGRIWQNTAETLDGSDSDGNNYIDDTEAGWDFANDDNLPVDDHGHGTNVAGIAIATGNNNIGYAGMNWNSQIMVCKVLDDANAGFYSWMTEAIYYAVDNGANVINLSVGGNSPSATLEAAVDYAFNNNVALVVSTGNQDSSIQYPARYTNAIAVGSTNSDDTRTSPFFWSATSGSNFGPEIDFIAPGNYMYGLSFSSDTNYNTYWGGTSQAAPHVAGLISLLLAVEPNLTVTQIRDILVASSEDQVGDADDTPGWDQYYGHGRINAYNALLSTTLSSSEFNISNEEISLYPNPISKGLNVTLSNIPNGDYETIIYDINGKTLFNVNLTSNSEKVEFDAPNLSNGFYFIKLTNTKNKQFIHKKIFIK
jgi:subtilisin family serine protease